MQAAGKWRRKPLRTPDSRRKMAWAPNASTYLVQAAPRWAPIGRNRHFLPRASPTVRVRFQLIGTSSSVRADLRLQAEVELTHLSVPLTGLRYERVGMCVEEPCNSDICPDDAEGPPCKSCCKRKDGEN